MNHRRDDQVNIISWRLFFISTKAKKIKTRNFRDEKVHSTLHDLLFRKQQNK